MADQSDRPVKTKSKKRFAQLTDEDLANKKIKVQKKNTVKADKLSENQFRQFLQEEGVKNYEFWLYDEPTLDKHLCKFWFALSHYL